MSKRPNFISTEDFSRWDKNIDTDPNIHYQISIEPIIREVLYAGLWLIEELEKLSCPYEFIARIQFAAGKLCFGRDPWEVHQSMLEKYKNDELKFEADTDIKNLN